jgi:CheY-like chemotaxis protein
LIAQVFRFIAYGHGVTRRLPGENGFQPAKFRCGPVPIIGRQKRSRLPLPDDIAEILEAVTAALRHRLLTCVNDLPSMSGLELIAHLRQAAKGIPALMVTGSTSAAIIARANQLGVAVLKKPPAEADLVTFINACL